MLCVDEQLKRIHHGAGTWSYLHVPDMGGRLSLDQVQATLDDKIAEHDSHEFDHTICPDARARAATALD